MAGCNVGNINTPSAVNAASAQPRQLNNVGTWYKTMRMLEHVVNSGRSDALRLVVGLLIGYCCCCLEILICILAYGCLLLVVWKCYVWNWETFWIADALNKTAHFKDHLRFLST